MSAVYLAEAGDNPLGRYLTLIHAEGGGAVLDEQPYLGESAFVKEVVYSFPGGPLPFLMALLNSLRSPICNIFSLFCLYCSISSSVVAILAPFPTL